MYTLYQILLKKTNTPLREIIYVLIKNKIVISNTTMMINLSCYLERIIPHNCSEIIKEMYAA